VVSTTKLTFPLPSVYFLLTIPSSLRRTHIHNQSAALKFLTTVHALTI